MFRRYLLGALPALSVAILGACALRPSPGPPVGLIVPAPFGTSVTMTHYRLAEDLVNSPPYHLVTTAPLTEYHGWFGPRTVRMGDDHAWTVRIYHRGSPRLLAAYANARNGYDADLDEDSEFLGGRGGGSYLKARFERKHWSWGDGVSFFTQSTQDTGDYVPNNGHLEYEVWGITRDHRFTVVATVFVSHPALADWGGTVRAAHDLKALQADRDYRLIETSAQDRFTPHLSDFDRLLDNLSFR